MAPVASHLSRQFVVRSPSARIHPTAVLDPKASIAADVVVGPYCVIGPGVRIGARTELRSHVCVYGPTTIGEDNVIHPFAVLGAEPQDLKFRGERSLLAIGSRNVIREHVTIHRGTKLGGGETSVGDDNLLMVGVHIAHDCVVESNVIIANNALLAGHCHIKSFASISGGVGLHHFVTVGEYAYVGGLARVPKDVPPFVLSEGSPSLPHKINVTGLERRGWTGEQIEPLRQAFKALFRRCDSEPTRRIAQRLLADPAQTEPVRRLCSFLLAMEQGVLGRQRERQRSPEAPRHGVNIVATPVAARPAG